MRKLGHDAHSRGSLGSSFVTDVRGNSCGKCGGFATLVRGVRALTQGRQERVELRPPYGYYPPPYNLPAAPQFAPTPLGAAPSVAAPAPTPAAAAVADATPAVPASPAIPTAFARPIASFATTRRATPRAVGDAS